MKSRAAILTQPYGEVTIDEIDLPEPAPNQVVLRLYSSGVCHTQLHNRRDPNLKAPFGLGHEGTGVVEKVGREVKHLSEGDLAISTWVPRTPARGATFAEPTGATYRGETLNARTFTWTEHQLAYADFVVKIEPDTPKDVSCIVGCAVHTGAGAVITTARVRPGDSVAVFGVGGVGLCAVAAASILGASPVIAVDLADEKLDFAREFGATHGLNSSNIDPVEAILDLTHGGVDFAFDTIGVRQTNEQIVPSVRPGGAGAENLGGTAVIVGVPGNEMTLDPGLLMHTQRIFRGSAGATYPDRDFLTFLRWHKEGRLPLDRLVTRRFQLDQAAEACTALERGEILGRAIIELG